MAAVSIRKQQQFRLLVLWLFIPLLVLWNTLFGLFVATPSWQTNSDDLAAGIGIPNGAKATLPRKKTTNNTISLAVGRNSTTSVATTTKHNKTTNNSSWHSDGEGRQEQQQERNETTLLLKFSNRWDRVRYVCGRAVQPNSKVILNASVVPHSLSNRRRGLMWLVLQQSSRETTIITTAATPLDNHYDNNASSSSKNNKKSYSDDCLVTVVRDNSKRERSFRLFASSRIFPVDPVPTETATTSGTPSNNHPAVRLGFEVPISKGRYSFENDCNVPCWQHGADTRSIVSYCSFEGTPMMIKQMSMEGSAYYPHLSVHPRAYRKHSYYATTSLESDVPQTYYSLQGQDLREYRPVAFDRGIKGASFLARNCNSRNHREDLLTDLLKEAESLFPGLLTTPAASMNDTILNSSNRTNDSNNSGFRIDSLSTCKRHAPHGFPEGTSSNSTKTSIMEKYLFHFAFENQNVDDYITEKLWGALESGTIPVYFGAPNIRDHLPHPHSAIIVEDFATKDNGTTNEMLHEQPKHNINATALVEHLWKVANNRTLYDSYHAWRTRTENASTTNINTSIAATNTTSPTSGGTRSDSEYDEFYQRFLDKYEFTRTPFVCRVCRFAYALQYGWGWDHTRQWLRSLRLPPPPPPFSDAVRANSTGLTTASKSPEYGNNNRGDHFHNRSTCFFGDRMVYPLREVWADDEEMTTVRGNSSNSMNCHGTFHHSRREVASPPLRNGPFLRTIWDHDGVTDMEIIRLSNSSSSSSFRLISPFGSNSTELIFVRRHTSYRKQSRRGVTAFLRRIKQGAANEPSTKQNVALSFASHSGVTEHKEF
jgi:hypothetical protein